MKIDIATGDAITPAAIQYEFPMPFDEKAIPVLAYTLKRFLLKNMKRLSAETSVQQEQGTITICIPCIVAERKKSAPIF